MIAPNFPAWIALRSADSATSRICSRVSTATARSSGDACNRRSNARRVIPSARAACPNTPPDLRNASETSAALLVRDPGLRPAPRVGGEFPRISAVVSLMR